MRKYFGPGRFQEEQKRYVTDTDRALFSYFLTENGHLESSVSFSTFYKYKPFWIYPHKWLTCKCPKCLEVESFFTDYKRKVQGWHNKSRTCSANRTQNPRPGDMSSGAPPENCLHCKDHNPMYTLGAGSGLEDLYRISVCAHALILDSKTSHSCAKGHTYYTSPQA